MPSTTTLLFTLLVCLVLARPAAAFGAGEVPAGSEFKGLVWRHGDLIEILKYLPTSFETSYRFTKLQRKQVYFGNWLRDFSQVIDTTCLEAVPEPVIRAIVSVLAFLEFGFATDEFDVTRERLGCYTHVEHIDNPAGYADNAKDIDERLRGPVDPRELEIDPATGMKNYVANSGRGWDTAADYIRQQLALSIELGRQGSRQYHSAMKKDAFRHLGAALHTLEDFSAHSNFTELCLQQLGEETVFAFVGDGCRVQVPHGPRKGSNVAPLVTGTFGMLDIFHSLLGEADDKAVLSSKGSLGELESVSNLPTCLYCQLHGRLIAWHQKLSSGGMAFDKLFHLLKTGIEHLSKIQPDLDPLLTQLQTVGEIFKKFSPDAGKKTAPAKSDSGVTDAYLLWKILEPVLYLHDRISMYLQEGQEDAAESTQDISPGPLGEWTNQLVFKYMAVMIESSVMGLRNALRAARDRVDTEAAKADSAQVYRDGTASNPSHSDLSKDHFSNVLNQPAGLVATVTTNWTTQAVVKCWDDPDADADATISEILTVLHHPAFPENKTPIQQYMFDAVHQWWRARPWKEQAHLRAKLTKEAVQRRQHEDHTLTLKDLEGRYAGPASFRGAWPKVHQPPKKASVVAAWTNHMIGDINWAIRLVRRGWRGDPVGACKEVFLEPGYLVHNVVLVLVAVVYLVSHTLLWPLGWAQA